jgi:uncharacterized protein
MSIETLESKLPDLYKDNSCDHDIGHIRRVVRNVRIIGEKENADLSILLPAAMLHDIACKWEEMKEVNEKHAVVGAEIAKKILTEMGFENVDKICSVILQHSLDSPTDEPRTLEGDCLFDADKLDAINPIGLTRFMQEVALVKNIPPQEAAEKYLNVVKGLEFKTKTGREMGKDRAEALAFCEKIIESGRV